MTDASSSRLIAGAAVLIVLAVAWDALASHRPPAPRPSARPNAPAADTTRPATRPQPAATASQGTSTDSSGESHYLEQLARSETRRRVRASAGATYLNEIVAESQDSALHRWNHRATDPVRVYIPPGAVANFHAEFLDAIRTAFRWLGGSQAPAPKRCTRVALSSWSNAQGRINCGVPAASACATVPTPP